MRRNGILICVKCDVPEGASRDELAGFVADALETWGGQYHPDDPLFNSISVKHVQICSTRFINPDPKRLDYLHEGDA